ncbi:hypothetical protein [Paraburkholderia nemoris]
MCLNNRVIGMITDRDIPMRGRRGCPRRQQDDRA